MSQPMINSVRVVNDSLRVVLSAPLQVPAPQVNVLPEALHWWSSPLFQTLLGGILAVGAGFLMEVVRDWRRSRGLRRRLAKELEMIVNVLGQLDRALDGEAERVRELLADVEILKLGYARSKDALASALEPFLLRDVDTWFATLRYFCQSTTARAVGLIQVKDRNKSDGPAVDTAKKGLLDAREEGHNLMAHGKSLARLLRQAWPKPPGEFQR